MKHAFSDVFEFFGGRNKFCGVFDVSSSALSQWIDAGGFPPLRAIQIEQRSNGKFKAVDLIAGGANDEKDI
jgi:DNA-binding transcriptional regulator YdaS (Cro superfamily)